ncbi:MAG TPA: transporter [Candidatus Dormibacteraeota bacterium]|nr:transporter [Candidatus Dormibacteraeota bacterium]
MCRIRSCWLSPVVLSTVAAATAAAQPAERVAPDKSRYTLFNPVPPEWMRELSPDRPDKTESPYTVDAGHFQLEMDFANFTYDQTDDATTRAWNVAPFNLKAGLLNQVDLQIVFGSYSYADTHAAGAVMTQSGVGDLATRLKINLWGNDGGRTAFALLPFVTFPSSTDGLGTRAVEGGVIFPLAVKLPQDFNLGLETAVSVLRDGDDGGYHEDFINSITVGHGLVGRLGGYVEFFSDISTESHAGWVGTVDAGLNFPVTENVQLDGGCNFGVTPAADDFNPFVGITVRF